MPFPGSMLDKGYQQLRTAKNNESSVELVIGSPVAWDTSARDGISVVKLTATNLADFAGILTKDLAAGEMSNNALAVEGVVYCNFLNSATADGSAGSVAYAEPVAAQFYCQVSDVPTRLQLLTDQTTGTSAHLVADEGSSAAQVLILPETQTPKKMLVSIPDISTADTLIIPSPGNIRLLGAVTMIGGTIATADADVTIGDGTNPSMTITVAYSGSAAGDRDVGTPSATAAYNQFTETDDIQVATDGASTNAVECWVCIYYTEV